MLQIGRQFRFVDSVIGRSLDLPDGIAAQGQRLGHRKATAVGADGVHKVVCLVIDFKHRALQQRSGRQAVGGVIVGRPLRDLDLSGDGRIFPFHQCGLSGLHINGFHLCVRHISLIFQLPQVVAATL